MVGIAACSHAHHALQYAEPAPLRHVVGAVLVECVVVFFLFLCLRFQFGAYLSHALKEQLGDFLKFHYRHVANLPAFEETGLDGVAYLLGHVGDGALLACVERLDAFLAEVVGIELSHDVVELVERAVGLLGLLGVCNGLVVPVVVERRVVGIALKHLLLERQVLGVYHPFGLLVGVEICLAVIFVALFVDESLIFAPVVVLELVEHALAHGVCYVLEHAQLGIHHALDAYRVDLLRACHGHRSHAVGILRLVVFEGKLVHVLVVVGAQDVAEVLFILLVYEEDTCEDVVAYYLRQLLERVHRHAVLVHIAVYGDTVCHALHRRVVELCRSRSCHVLRTEAACLQRVELVYGGISVLIVASLIHVALRKVHLRYHRVDRDYGIGECLAGLDDGVYDRA